MLLESGTIEELELKLGQVLKRTGMDVVPWLWGGSEIEEGNVVSQSSGMKEIGHVAQLEGGGEGLELGFLLGCLRGWS